MNTKHPLDIAANDSSFNAVYDIRISERQRYYLHKGIQALLREGKATGASVRRDGSNVYDETDEFGSNIVVTLEDLFNPEGSTGIPALNCFVL